MLKKIVCIMGAVAIFILAVGCSSEPQKPSWEFLWCWWCYKMGERKTVYGRSC
nr:hypothetical protein [Phascolarctobacterium sp.]